MPKGPRGEKRPADVIGAAVMVGRIATGEIEEDCGKVPQRAKGGLKGETHPRSVFHVDPFFLKSVIFVVLTIFTELDPIGRCAVGPRLIQVNHPGAVISTTFVRFLRPGTGRSVILM
jgi:hypothetical protein